MKINYEELQIAMSAYNQTGIGQHYLDTETGSVLLVNDWVTDKARKFEDPSAVEDESIRLAWYLLWYHGKAEPQFLAADKHTTAQQADQYLKRFLAIPLAASSETYQDMVAFTDTVTHPHLRKQLEMALNGRRPFRRFKDALYDYPKERERWFNFSSQCWRRRIDDWLKKEGLLNEDVTTDKQ
jgi:hypothetical protein